MPARLLLCLLFRSSWLTVAGDRHVGAAGVLIAGADRQPWLSRSAGLLAFRSDIDFRDDFAFQLFCSAAKQKRAPARVSGYVPADYRFDLCLQRPC